MNEVFIDVRGLDNKDYFTTALLSVEQWVVCIENLTDEIETLKEKIEDLEQTENEKWTDYWINRGMDKDRGID